MTEEIQKGLDQVELNQIPDLIRKYSFNTMLSFSEFLINI